MFLLAATVYLKRYQPASSSASYLPIFPASHLFPKDHPSILILSPLSPLTIIPDFAIFGFGLSDTFCRWYAL